MEFIRLLIIFLISFSCQFSGQKNESSVTGSVRLLATDAPFPVDLASSAQITVSEIRLRSDDGKSATLLDQAITLELLDLRNGIQSLISESVIPEGKYNQISLIVEEALIQLKDGRSFPLKVPSGSTSGLKIFLSPEVEVRSGVVSDVLLDFDLSRSFVAKGSGQNITGFNFKPVIRGAGLATSGALFGKVYNSMDTEQDQSDDLPVGGATITLMKGEEIVATAISENDGLYKFIGLAPGVYTAAAVAEGLAPQEISQIEVKAGEDYEQDFILNSESPSNNL